MPKVDKLYLEARRDEILDAAAKSFSRSGFQEATIQDIAQEAGLSHGAIYRYFATKDDIIEAVARSDPQGRAQSFAVAGLDAEPMRELLSVLQAHTHTHGLPENVDDGRLRMEILSTAGRNPRIRAVVRDLWEDVVGRFSEIVRRGQDQGTINPALDTATVARVITALHDGIYIHRTIDPSLDASAIDEVIGALLDGTFRVNGTEGSRRNEPPLHTESEPDIAT
ncbi:MAG: TetR/AcrR family transcriptional regulator [Acidimicrobiia bacterium]|nr:TetR/AcrR family transcriptional regulator [Acidimicrobiia bacterium]